MNFPEVRISKTKDLPKPTYYVKALDGEFGDHAYNEERALEYKGQWRERAFKMPANRHMDLEIGTGNGYHFAHYAKAHPERLLLGIELKYKPLIQSIRRALRDGSENAQIMRYDARYLTDLFVEGELNDVIIHHPDPWLKRRQTKNRLLQLPFLKMLYQLQRPGSRVEIKMDNREYFDAVMEAIEQSDYKVDFVTFDLHSSELAGTTFKTQFEKIFMKQGLPIHLVRLSRP